MVSVDTHILGVPTCMRQGFGLCHRLAQKLKAKKDEKASASDPDAFWYAALAHVKLQWHKGLATPYLLWYLHLTCYICRPPPACFTRPRQTFRPKGPMNAVAQWPLQPFMFDPLALGATSHELHLLRLSDKHDYAAVLPHQSHNNSIILVFWGLQLPRGPLSLLYRSCVASHACAQRLFCLAFCPIRTYVGTVLAAFTY